jgi:integrase
MLLHTALQHAVALQLLATNPAHAVKAPKVQHVEMHTLDEEGALTVLKAAMDTPYYALFHTALATGMRRGELLALRWQDIDLLGAEVSVSRSMHRLNTHVTMLMKNGTPPLVVMQRLGHANIGITLGTYSHVTPGMQKQAAETFGKMFGHGISRRRLC